MYFGFFVIISLWKRIWPFLWTNLKLNHGVCQVWLKLANWFWRRGFLNFINLFLLCHNYLSFEKSMALHLNKLKSPLPKDALCKVWLKLVQWFGRIRWNCEKFTDRQTNRQMDEGRQAIRRFTWALSSGDLNI